MFNIKKIDQYIRELNHRRIDLTRALILKLFKLFFDRRVLIDNEKVIQNEAILVLRLDDKIGDSITATGFLKTIKLSYPQSKLVVVAGKSAALVYHRHKYIDQVIVLQKGFFSTVKLFFKLRKSQFNFIINTTHILNPRILFLTRFLIAKKKITFLNLNYKMFSEHVIFNLNQDHVTKRYKNTLNLLNINRDIDDYDLVMNENVLKEATDKLKPYLQENTNLIVLNSFAGARLRNFNEATTITLVKRLLQRKNNLIVSIGNENDLPLITNWMRNYSHERWIYFKDKSEFEFNCALLKLAHVIITPDTAVVHIASAFKKKLICIYREDRTEDMNSLVWAPFKTISKTIIAPYDSNLPDDINTVSIDQVVKACDEFTNQQIS